MADQKVTALTAIGTLGADDLFYVVDDPLGAPLSRKVTGQNVKTYTLIADQYSADAVDRELTFNKSRHATVGSHTIVVDGDDLGTIRWQGSNGTTFDTAAMIMAEVNGTPGAATDMPGLLSFWTTPDASATPVERLRIDNSGQVIIAEGTAGAEYAGGTVAFQVSGTQGSTSRMGFGRWSADSSGPRFMFQKSRTATIGGVGSVAADDSLGTLRWAGADGLNFDGVSAEIQGEADGTYSEAVTPGRLVFKTTPDGSNAAVERMRINNFGKVTYEFASTFTNTIASTVVHRHTTTGTAANGIGQALVFEQDTGTANYEIGCVINTIFEDTTSTSEDSAVRIDTMVAGAVTTAQWINRVKRTSAAHSVATSVATEVTELTFNAVQPGTYGFRYNLLNQSASTGAGLGFGLHFTGTAAQFRAIRRYAGITSLAAGNAGNGTTSTITGQFYTAHACSAFASTTANMVNTGVQAINTDHMEVIEGMMTVTAVGDFHLFHASEVATTTRVSSNSIAFLERYA